MGRFPKLLTGLFKDFRNSYNAGVDAIEKDIDQALNDSKNAITNSTQAIASADQAKSKADSVQTQLDNIVMEGDSSLAAAQAAVDAKGVTKSSLKKRLDDDYNEVTTALAQKAEQIDLEVERARINNLTTLPQGSTTGDAELIDGRVGANGKTYTNIGGAIRGQFGLTNKALDVLVNQNNILSDPLITSVVTVNTGLDIWEYINGVPSLSTKKYAIGNVVIFAPNSVDHYLVQDISVSKMSQGEYKVSMLFGADWNESNKTSDVFITFIGYPTSAYSGGTTFGEIKVTVNSSDCDKNGNYRLKLPYTIPSLTTYHHIRMVIRCTTRSIPVRFAEIIAIKDVDYQSFSKLNQLVDYNPLRGKKICVNGDSICYGAGYLGGYTKIIADKNEMSYQNIAVSGATIASGTFYSDGVTPRHYISQTMVNLDNDGDYYIIEGGFNDAGNNVNPNANAYSDVISTVKPNDLTNTLNAMENICYELVVNHTGKKIGFIFPHRIFNNEWTVQTGNTYNYHWGNYKELQKKVLKKWGVPFLDLAEVSGMNTIIDGIASTYTNNSDRVHPNELGYKTFYVPKIEAWMKTL